MRLLRACWGASNVANDEGMAVQEGQQRQCKASSLRQPRPSQSTRASSISCDPVAAVVAPPPATPALSTNPLCTPEADPAAPYAVTVLSCVDENGRARVLSQNQLSRGYYGPRDVVHDPSACTGASGDALLRELFHLEGGQELQAMLQAVLHGDQASWRRTMRVPATQGCHLTTRPEIVTAATWLKPAQPSNHPIQSINTGMLEAENAVPNTVPQVPVAPTPEPSNPVGNSSSEAAPTCALSTSFSAGALRVSGGVAGPPSPGSAAQTAATPDATAGSPGSQRPVVARRASKRLQSLTDLATGSGSPLARSPKSTRRLSIVLSSIPVAEASGALSGSNMGTSGQALHASGNQFGDSVKSAGQTDRSSSAMPDASLMRLETEISNYSLDGANGATSGAALQKVPSARTPQLRACRLSRAPSVRPDSPEQLAWECQAREDAGGQEFETQAVVRLESSGLNWSADKGHDTPEDFVWHEVYVTKSKAAHDDRPVLMVYQSDVTQRTHLEAALAKLTEVQLGMLCQIFPRHVLEAMSTGGGIMRTCDLAGMARSHNDVSILFMDICGFTDMSKQVAPQVVMSFLNELFSLFDTLCSEHRCHKIETAGDCYIVSSGLLSMDEEDFYAVREKHDPCESAARLLAFARGMLRVSQQVTLPHNGSPVRIRVGMHSGPCVSGIVGSKLPKFSVFGDTMNTASRMESTCTPGRIQISAATHTLLMGSGTSSAEEWEATGGIEVKGKGRMDTYLWKDAGAVAADSSTQSEAAAAAAAACAPGAAITAADRKQSSDVPGCGRGTSGTASDPPAVGGLAHGRHPNLHAFDFQAVSTLLHAIGSASGPQPPSCNAMHRLWPAMTAALPATDSEHRTGTDDEASAKVALHQCLISRLEGVDRVASRGRGQGAPNSFAQLLLSAGLSSPAGR